MGEKEIFCIEWHLDLCIVVFNIRCELWCFIYFILFNEGGSVEKGK